jgi:hypothetical protein
MCVLSRLFALPVVFMLGAVWICAPAVAQKSDTVLQKDDNLLEVLVTPTKFYQKFFPNLKIKPNPPDTTYIKTYPNYLTVSTFVLSPSIRTDISPAHAGEKGASNFRTNIPDILGFNANYRFVAAGFAFLLNSGLDTHKNYAKSKYRTATVKLSGGAFSLEYKFKRFKGLTDVNPDNRTNATEPYRLRPDIVNREYQLDLLYNPGWRKYSYQAPFTFSQRQVRSKMGFLMNVGVSFIRMTGDSALITKQQQQFIKGFDAVQAINTTALRIAPGIGSNVVFFRQYYFSVVMFPSCDVYFYKFFDHADDRAKPNQAVAWVLDAKAGIGYQSKRFYAGLRYEAERRQASLRAIGLTNRYTFLGIEVGYRFNAPGVVKKIYKDTMPPGM